MKIKKLIKLIRVIPILIGVKWKKPLILKDLQRWKDIKSIHEHDIVALAMIMWDYPEFRNLYIYRNSNYLLYRMWVKLWYHPVDTLYIDAKEIGGGLFIQHGFATMIAAERIGENCWINQQVTIGYRNQGKPPVIEDNVTITCGAKVLGDITVGRGATIGANAVVIKDVEPGAVMVGIPAHRIK